MLSRWPIRNKLLVGIALLLVIVAAMATSSIQGTYAYRQLVRSISSRATELPLASAVLDCVSDLRVTLANLEVFSQHPEISFSASQEQQLKLSMSTSQEQQLSDTIRRQNSDTFRRQFASVCSQVQAIATNSKFTESYSINIGSAKQELETLNDVEASARLHPNVNRIRRLVYRFRQHQFNVDVELVKLKNLRHRFAQLSGKPTCRHWPAKSAPATAPGSSSPGSAPSPPPPWSPSSFAWATAGFSVPCACW